MPSRFVLSFGDFMTREPVAHMGFSRNSNRRLRFGGSSGILTSSNSSVYTVTRPEIICTSSHPSSRTGPWRSTSLPTQTQTVPDSYVSRFSGKTAPLTSLVVIRDCERAGLSACHEDRSRGRQSQQHPCFGGPPCFDMRLRSCKVDAFDNFLEIQGCGNGPLAKSGALG